MANDRANRDIEFQDLFRGVEFHEEDVSIDIKLPDSFFYNLTDYFMERSYLNTVPSKRFSGISGQHEAIRWLKITQLPVNPDKPDGYDLISRWQGVLSALHAWDYRLIFLLLRKDGETGLYLGTGAFHQETDGRTINITAAEAAEQVREAASGSMPGIGLETVTDPLFIGLSLSDMPYVGAVTGIPSFREEEGSRLLQTLDPLAFGLKDANNADRDYALLVMADPIRDAEVAEIIRRHRELSTRLHTEINTVLSTGKSSTDQNRLGVGVSEASPARSSIGHIIGEIIGSALGIPDALEITKDILGTIRTKGAATKEKNISLEAAASVKKEYVDQYAAYAEQLINKHINRLNEGRNLGFWNTGVYLLGGYEDVRTAAGLLRSIYSGKETYLEPIRIHCFPKNQEIEKIIKSFNLLPLLDRDYSEAIHAREGFQPEKDTWHILGKPYQYVSTPMNTAELSLTTSLPRRDVPGLKLTGTAVRFAGNPVGPGKDDIPFGNMIDMGVKQSDSYPLEINRLSRHALITGTAGSGKSVSARFLLESIQKRHIPFLVLEPNGDDYVRWATQLNRDLPKERQIKIYKPGDEQGYPDTVDFGLNLFQPAAPCGQSGDPVIHSENLAAILNAYLPFDGRNLHRLEDACIRTASDFAASGNREGYPSVDRLIRTVTEPFDNRGVKEPVDDPVLSGLNYLKRGIRGRILGHSRSIDPDGLFSGSAVINLSGLTGSGEKALVMALLLLNLFEYRAAQYRGRNPVEKNRLRHLTLIEEAHLVFSSRKSAPGTAGARVSDLLTDMLSGIRNYGEGFVLVEQNPAGLPIGLMRNIDLKISHRLTSAEDRTLMASELALREEQKALLASLDVGNAIIYGNMDHAATWIKLPTPQTTITKDFDI